MLWIGQRSLHPIVVFFCAWHGGVTEITPCLRILLDFQERQFILYLGQPQTDLCTILCSLVVEYCQGNPQYASTIHRCAGSLRKAPAKTRVGEKRFDQSPQARDKTTIKRTTVQGSSAFSHLPGNAALIIRNHYENRR